MFCFDTLGGRIVVPPKAADHLGAHPDVLALLPDACSRLALPTDGSRLEAEIDMGRPVGRATRVTAPCVGPLEPCLFAQRPGRDGPSRVVQADDPPAVSTLVIVAYQERPRVYALVTAYVGTRAPAEPWSRPPGRERDRCLHFWSHEALVQLPEIMGPVFESTWAEVLWLHDGRAQSQEQTGAKRSGRHGHRGRP